MAALNGNLWSAGNRISPLLGPHCTTCIFLCCFLVRKACRGSRTIAGKKESLYSCFSTTFHYLFCLTLFHINTAPVQHIVNFKPVLMWRRLLETVEKYCLRNGLKQLYIHTYIRSYLDLQHVVANVDMLWLCPRTFACPLHVSCLIHKKMLFTTSVYIV